MSELWALFALIFITVFPLTNEIYDLYNAFVKRHKVSDVSNDKEEQ